MVTAASVCKMTGMSPRALLLFGHADHDSDSPTLNQRLARAYVSGYEANGGQVERIDIASLTFDPVLRTGFRQTQPLEPDLVRVKEAVERASHVVWVFPMYWAAPPAIVRGLFDRLFLPGWAFRYEGGNPLPKGLLAGRSARVILTMDSPWFWYTLVNHRAVHRSFGGASLKFCGFAPVSFTTVHDVRSLSASARDRWCDKVVKVGGADARLPARPRA